MAEDKKGFLLYADYEELFDELSDEIAGKLIKHILKYVNDKNPTTNDPFVNIAFIPIKKQLKRDLEKYECKREQWSEAGKRSAEARRLKREQTLNDVPTDSTDVKTVPTDSTVNVNDNVNVTVNVNDTVINIPPTPKGEIIDFDILLKFINEKFGRKYKVINDAVRKKYKGLLKSGYEKDDITRAIIKCKESNFHIDNNYQYCTPEFFARSSTIDKWGTATVKQPKQLPSISMNEINNPYLD